MRIGKEKKAKEGSVVKGRKGRKKNRVRKGRKDSEE